MIMGASSRSHTRKMNQPQPTRGPEALLHHITTGNTVSGKTEAERYYLAGRGRYAEVSHALFVYSKTY